jgi:hypothetical protein
MEPATAPTADLGEEYARMAADREREAEALEWIEALIGDAVE